MDMRQFRALEQETAEPLAGMTFQLLLASASARQASSQTTNAVIRHSTQQTTSAAPDQYRIQILSSRNEAFGRQKPRLARFSDLTLPDHYFGLLPVSLDSEATK